jgi:hypothetical protein
MQLGDWLEDRNHFGEALAVYGQGLALGSNRREFWRRHILARSNLNEQSDLAQSAGPAPADVGRKLDAIKCHRLERARALAACRKALKADPASPRIRARIEALEALLGVVTYAQSADTNGIRWTDQGALPSPVPGSQTVTQLPAQELASRQADGRVTQRLGTAHPPARIIGQQTAILDGLDIGRFHALVIGSNDYRDFPPLETAVNDAASVADILRKDYGFRVETLINATRYEIVSALSRLRSRLSRRDNLLVYYAGHGILDEPTARGYWLPVDAEQNNFANWLSTADVTDALKGMQAQHVLVVADACYSGSLSRRLPHTMDDGNSDRRAHMQRLVLNRSRTVLSSGGLEPVLDSGGGRHSVFTGAFLNVLRENQGVLEAGALFRNVRARVVANADQTPEYSQMRQAGHRDGEFIFVRIR